MGMPIICECAKEVSHSAIESVQHEAKRIAIAMSKYTFRFNTYKVQGWDSLQSLKIPIGQSEAVNLRYQRGNQKP